MLKMYLGQDEIELGAGLLSIRKVITITYNNICEVCIWLCESYCVEMSNR